MSNDASTPKRGRGRPKLGNVNINTKVRPDVKQRLKEEAKRQGCGVGELIWRITDWYFERGGKG